MTPEMTEQKRYCAFKVFFSDDGMPDTSDMAKLSGSTTTLGTRMGVAFKTCFFTAVAFSQFQVV